jgi:hypothetical protein
MTILYKEKKLAEIQENDPKWLFLRGEATVGLGTVKNLKLKFKRLYKIKINRT